jgi:hypothetical protein
LLSRPDIVSPTGCDEAVNHGGVEACAGRTVDAAAGGEALALRAQEALALCRVFANRGNALADLVDGHFAGKGSVLFDQDINAELLSRRAQVLFQFKFHFGLSSC